MIKRPCQYKSPFHNGPLEEHEVRYLDLLVDHHKAAQKFIRDVVRHNDVNSIIEIGSYLGNVMYNLSDTVDHITLTEAEGEFDRSDYLKWCDEHGFRFRENRIDASGIQIIDDDQCYDCFVALETLEHLPLNPKLSIDSMAERLNVSGSIIISVPNRNSLAKIRKFFKGQHPYINFHDFYSSDPVLANFGHHWLEFTIEDLDMCFENAGFRRTHLTKCNINYTSKVNTLIKNIISKLTGYRIYDQIYASYQRI
ncbi:class I SAM-dependent methyltransferase [Planktomarina temperata]|nr:class I SAM-dependent methyltransferase [Planktomarina temperata]